MQKRILGWVVLLSFVMLIIVFSVEEIRAFVTAFILRLFFFVKQNIFSLLAAFFLVKGKFILTLFLKKLALLTITGLGKRYVVEKIVMGNVKTHFLDHLSDDIKRLVKHAKENFNNFTIVKKIIMIFAFLGSLGFVTKFMGGMLAVKVFVAKVWSFLLAVFLKAGTAIVYFFTEYLWGSWLAPLVEFIVFTWLLSWLEKVPFLAKIFRKIYTFFIAIFGWMEKYIEKLFHIPIKAFFAWLVRKIQKSIYSFIGYEKVSAWKRLREDRQLIPNKHTQLLLKRSERKKEKKYRVKMNIRENVLNKRKTKRD